MSKTTVAINKIKEDLDSISGLDGGVGEYVEMLQKEIHERVMFLKKWMHSNEPENLPLTENQIRERIGKWIWFDEKHIKSRSMWKLIYWIKNDQLDGDKIYFDIGEKDFIYFDDINSHRYDIYDHEPNR